MKQLQNFFTLEDMLSFTIFLKPNCFIFQEMHRRILNLSTTEVRYINYIFREERTLELRRCA